MSGELQVDRDEKKRLRDHIGERVDVSGARLSDDDAVALGEFVDSYDETYKGRSETRTGSHDGWSSDGKYTRTETFTDTFMNDVVGIRQEYKYQDDDGQHGSSTTEVTDARGILNWRKKHS